MTEELSTLDEHRRAIADILAFLSKHGLAGVMLSPDKIDGSPLGPRVFADLVRWLESEGVVRLWGSPVLSAGAFPKVQLTAVGLKILGLESPTSKGEKIESSLAKPSSPKIRAEIGEFVGRLLGGFANTQM
ncbi:hypothetical protein FJ938_20820 [Mesorhizobium sp. B2-4-14]|uniref:hypothetical protein n=1 Tax=Mesorhizobium sp. B2-4-14 TaxID=2589935 RepID=UPI00112DC087|nr:hypothetical protein [Mesorhizobium sp. B2-4-14]TPL01365.1 hypothetical protein FJ938_20820 [Mesorhizobium sp. B2-4-14]